MKRIEPYHIAYIILALLMIFYEPQKPPEPILPVYPSEYIQTVEKRVQSEPVKPQRTYMTVEVTAYCSCAECCGPNASGITASGKKVKVGMIAASRNIKFGTRIKIAGKIYTVEDRLAKRYDKRIDIYCESHEEALKHGVRIMKVEVLNND